MANVTRGLFKSVIRAASKPLKLVGQKATPKRAVGYIVKRINSCKTAGTS